MKKTFWSVMLVLMLLGVAGCFAFIGWHVYSDMGAQQIYETIQDLVKRPGNEQGTESNGDTTADESVSESVLTVEDIESVEFTGEREGEEAPLPADILKTKSSTIRKYVSFGNSGRNFISAKKILPI